MLNFFPIPAFESTLHSKLPLLSFLILAALLAGCGHKGPLFLPAQKPLAAKPAASQPAPAADAATAQP